MDNGDKILIDEKKLVLSVSNLPVLPETLSEILDMVSDPSVSAVMLEAIIARDQSLAARVLKIANSPLYGFSRELETIKQAVVVLGAVKIRGIATAMSMAPMFKSTNNDLINGQRLWDHALACSLWAQVIAYRLKTPQAELLFSAGLMHDLGIVLLNQYAPDDYRTVLLHARKKGIPLARAEYKLMGTDHARIGAAMCAHWKFPPSLTQLVCYHEAEQLPVEPLAQVLRLADLLSALSGQGEFEWSPEIEVGGRLLDALGLSPEDLAAFTEWSEDIQAQTQMLQGA